MLVPANFTDGTAIWINVDVANFIRRQVDGSTFVEYGAAHRALATKDTHDRVQQTPAALLDTAGISWPSFPNARGETTWINPVRVVRVNAGRDGGTFVHFGGTFQVVEMPPELVVAALNQHGWGRTKAVA